MCAGRCGRSAPGTAGPAPAERGGCSGGMLREGCCSGGGMICGGMLLRGGMLRKDALPGDAPEGCSARPGLFSKSKRCGEKRGAAAALHPGVGVPAPGWRAHKGTGPAAAPLSPLSKGPFERVPGERRDRSEAHCAGGSALPGPHNRCSPAICLLPQVILSPSAGPVRVSHQAVERKVIKSKQTIMLCRGERSHAECFCSCPGAVQ